MVQGFLPFKKKLSKHPLTKKTCLSQSSNSSIQSFTFRRLSNDRLHRPTPRLGLPGRCSQHGAEKDGHDPPAAFPAKGKSKAQKEGKTTCFCIFSYLVGKTKVKKEGKDGGVLLQLPRKTEKTATVQHLRSPKPARPPTSPSQVAENAWWFAPRHESSPRTSLTWS